MQEQPQTAEDQRRLLAERLEQQQRQSAEDAKWLQKEEENMVGLMVKKQ